MPSSVGHKGILQDKMWLFTTSFNDHIFWKEMVRALPPSETRTM